ncbi:MAG: hypothetical protein ACTHNB_11555 [Gaiellaceae bacterium]
MAIDDVDAARLEHEPISPELALVSPELAEFARAGLPDPSDVFADLASKRRAEAAAALPRQPEPVRPEPSRGRRRALSTLALLGATGLGLLAGIEIAGQNAAQVFTSAQFAPAAPNLTSPSPTSSSKQKIAGVLAARAERRASRPASKPSAASKRKTSRLSTAPRLRWTGVRGASYYNVRLFRGRVRILDLWPSQPVVKVPRAWVYGGVHYSLRPGRYTWFVYPGIGKPSRLRLQRLHKTGVLIVPK